LQAVCIDIWPAFENSVRKHAPQAEIVSNKFHIAKHLNDTVHKVRRAEHKELKAKGDHRLTGTRQLWLFHPENLGDSRQDEFTQLRNQQRQTSRAWAIKHDFRWFREYPDADSAREFFEDWYSWPTRPRLPPVNGVATRLRERPENILTCFRHHTSNPSAEGSHSRIQSIQANAHGFRNFRHYRIRILFFCGKFKLPPAID